MDRATFYGARGTSASSSWKPQDFNVTLVNPDGVDSQIARLTWEASAVDEIEIYRSLDGGAYALLITLGLGIATYDDELFDGTTHTADYYARFKKDSTVLSVPTGLTLTEITGGVRVTWDDNNTEADHIEILADIDSTGYALVTTVLTGVETYDHTTTGVNINYKIRAKEGTLPVYSSYTSPVNIDMGVYDNDGNAYNKVVIGTQTWLVQNFKSTKYLDGSAIPVMGNAAARAADVTGAMDWYNGDSNNKAIYGGLYNAYALANVKGFGITGWHIPTDAEWNTLVTYLSTTPATKMADTGTTGWNTNWGSNASGWTGRGGGWSNAGTGAWEYLKGYGFWHAATGSHRNLQDGVSTVTTFARGAKTFASVRLIKD